MLSRGVAGIRKRTLIVNLPGSPRGAVESLGVIMPVLPHAVEFLTTATPRRATPPLTRRRQLRLMPSSTLNGPAFRSSQYARLSSAPADQIATPRAPICRA